MFFALEERKQNLGTVAHQLRFQIFDCFNFSRNIDFLLSKGHFHSPHL